MTNHYLRTGAEGVRYASMEAAELDKKKVEHYEALREEEGDEWVDERLAALAARTVEGEPMDVTHQQAGWAYSHGMRLRAYGRQSQTSAIAQFVQLLNEDPEPLTEAEKSDKSKKAFKDAMDKHIRRVRELARNEHSKAVPWPDMIHWTHDGTRENPGKQLVPAKVIRAIQDKIDEGIEAAAKRNATAAAKKAAAVGNAA